LSLRIRCWVHKMANVLDKIPESHQQEIKAFLTDVRDAPDYETGTVRARELIERYQNQFPRAMKSFADDLEASLNHLQVPVIHRKYVRTTNLIERSFGEEKRRSKVIPRFFDEKSALKLAFSTLWRTSQRWRKVKFSEIEQKLIHELRRQLGLATGSTDQAAEEGQDNSVITS